MSATRPIAMPRMNREAGKKAHAVIVQIRVCGEVKVIGTKPAPAMRTTAGIRKGNRNPSAMLMRLSRVNRATTSPPEVGSKVGRLIQTLKGLSRLGHRPAPISVAKMPSESREIR